MALGFAAAGARLVVASRKIEGVAAVAEKIQLEGGEAVSVASETGRVCRRRGLAAELAALEQGRDKTRVLSSGMMQELFMRTRLI